MQNLFGTLLKIDFPNFIGNTVELIEELFKKISTMTLFADSESDPEEGSSTEEGDEDLHGDEGDSEDYKNKDHSAEESEIDKIGQELEGESDHDGEEELEEEEVQKDSSDAEKEEDDSEDAGEVEEGNEEEDEIEGVKIAGLDDLMFGNPSFNNHALFTITNSVVEICNEVSGKNNRESADAMLALSKKMLLWMRYENYQRLLNLYSTFTKYIP
jgi:hypothetical protein